MTYQVLPCSRRDDLNTDCTRRGKYCDLGYGIRFDSRSIFPVSNADWSKKAIVFEIGNSQLVHIDERKKGTLILNKDPVQRLDDTTTTAEA